MAMQLLKINGINLPCPSSFEVVLQDFQSDDTGRSSDGSMHIDVIATKRQLSIGWNYLENDTLFSLLRLFDGRDTYEVYFPDATVGTFITRTMYVGDRSYAIKRVKPDGTIVYDSISITLVEI